MNTLEQKIFQLAEPIATELNYNIVDVKTFGKEKITLQIFLEKKDFSSVSIDDCAKFSREFSVILDVNNLIEKRYNLEVSSAGIDRKLSKVEDFERFIGKNVVVKTKLPILGQKSFKGQLLSVKSGSLNVLTNENNNIEINIDLIEKANLDILKDLFKDSNSNKNTKQKKIKKEEKHAK